MAHIELPDQYELPDQSYRAHQVYVRECVGHGGTPYVEVCQWDGSGEWLAQVVPVRMGPFFEWRVRRAVKRVRGTQQRVAEMMARVQRMADAYTPPPEED